LAISEPDVTLTDFVLALECGIFAFLLYRKWSRSNFPIFRWFVYFFVSLAVASLAGGIVHGFFAQSENIVSRLLWRSTMAALGMAAWSAWAVGAAIYFSEKIGRWIVRIAGLEFLLYLFIVLFLNQAFIVAVANYFPAGLFLFLVYLRTYLQTKDLSVGEGLAGIGLIFIGSLLQQMKVSVHPVYFTHNALYHAIEGMALFFIFLSTRSFIKGKE
jgi:hypothetical protein